MTKHDSNYQAFGLHPLVAFGVVAIDLMLFGGEASTAGVSWFVSVGVAAALAIPVLLLQRYAYHDDWGTAAGKAVLLSLLTAIPTPIPAIFPVAAGVLGMFKKHEALPAAITATPLPDRSAPEQLDSLESELGRVIDKHGIANT